MFRRAGIWIGALLIVALATVGGLATSAVRKAWPQTTGTIALEGLGGSVSVARDERGIPTITADNPTDLFRAQGFVSAQDRFFEMDLRRHIASGRLAELVGAAGVNADKAIRTMGWRKVAEEELPTLAPATRLYLGAYADGVNDYLTRAGEPANLAVEYQVLATQLPDYRVEKWSAVDSLVWLKAMAYDLRGNFNDELARGRLTGTLGAALVDALYPPYPTTDHVPILSAEQWSPTRSTSRTLVPAALTAASTASAPPARSAPSASVARTTATTTAVTSPTTTAALATLPELADPEVTAALTSASALLESVVPMVGRGEGVGSNSWVVGPSLTKSGKPLLANDPHLGVSIPGIWSQVGLRCRTVTPECPFAVSGFALAGVPGVVIGHNASIAWGFTNLGPDVTDFYLERVTDTAYQRDGRQFPLQVTSETIKVRGGADVPLTVRRTSHGPIVSDVFPAAAEVGKSPLPGATTAIETYAVSLAWTGLVPSTSADAIFALDTATDFTAFRAAAKLFAVPSQNLVYADTSGNIGYQAPGLIPVRRSATSGLPPGFLPSPGWNSQWDWEGWVPFEDLPWVLNPAEGFLVAANQQVTASSTPFLTTEWDAGWRSQRIRDRLTGATPGSVTVADMAAIQADVTDGFAQVLVPSLVAVDLSDDPFTGSAQALLKSWDYSTPADGSEASAAAAYFYAVWTKVLAAAFDDQLPPDLRADGGSRWRLVVTALLRDPTNPWWDDKRTPAIVESRDEILRQSLVQARLALTKSLGSDVQGWSWGKVHTLTLTHRVLGADPVPGPIRAMVNRGPFPLPGGSAVVNANGWNASSGFVVNWAPSMRMVVDLANLDSSTWVNQTGQSGHPYHPHYADQIDAWSSGGTFPWPFTDAALTAARRDELILTPVG